MADNGLYVIDVYHRDKITTAKEPHYDDNSRHKAYVNGLTIPPISLDAYSI